MFKVQKHSLAAAILIRTMNSDSGSHLEPTTMLKAGQPRLIALGLPAGVPAVPVVADDPVTWIMSAVVR